MLLNAILKGLPVRSFYLICTTTRHAIITVMTAILLHCTISSNAQQVNLSVKDAPLETVLKKIQQQTGYRFVYTQEHMNLSHKVSLSITNLSLEKTLDACFQEQPLEFSVEDGYVIIRPKQTGTGRLPAKDSVIAIDGLVVNEKGEAMAAATITVEETRFVTVTNNRGEFHISNVHPDNTITISNVGYNTVQMPVRGQRFFHVLLKLAVNSLDETVVIAYGTTTRRLNTGAVGRLTADDISKQPVSNPLGALEGRITGLHVSQTNGLPGSNFTVFIRGVNSIQSGNAPLYIIDGIPFLNNINSFTQRSGLVANSPFNNIDPSTIESIEVLKDADATAIYGSRGANGVILITTRKAKEAGTHVSFNYTQSFSHVRSAMPMMNTPTYLAMRREAFANDKETPDEINAPDLLVWDTTRYTDWKKVLIGKTSHSENGQIQVSGGNASTKFGVGLGYLHDGTVFPGDFYDQRVNGNFFVSHQSLNKKFNLSVNTSYTNEKTHLPQQDLTNYINLPPNMYPPFDSLGNLQWSEKPGTVSIGNPLAVLQQPYNTETDRFTASGQIGYKIMKNLSLRTSLGYNQFLFHETSLYPISSQDPSYGPQGSMTMGSSAEKTWNVEPQLEYTNDKVGTKGKLSVLVGTTFQASNDYTQLDNGYGYTNDLLLGSLKAAPYLTATNSTSQYRYNALFARVNYNWSNRYLLNATGRRDGSSRFGPGKQFANFGAIGAAWIFSDEHWIQADLPFLSFGKLRGSYGITGNDKIGNYQYLDSYMITNYPYQSLPGLRPARLYNPGFSWENNLKSELALEFGFLKNRILFNIAYFRNKSTNQIIQYNLPGQTGFTGILMNFPGVVSNKGWEMELQTVNIHTANFSWRTAFNITANKNSLDEFPGLASSSYANTYKIGQPLNLKIGYQYLGVNAQTGLYTFNDLNKDGVLNDKDYVTIGTTDPKFYGGLLNTFQYKNWQLDIHFQFVKQMGIDPVYSTGMVAGSMFNQPELLLNRWQQPGDHKPYQQYTQSFISEASEAVNYVQQSTALLTNASFVRCKNIALQYNFKESVVKQLKLASAQAFVQAQNLFTLTKYKGLDPESQSTVTLPPLFTMAAGIKLSL
ncbi:SusC/RagA family TonB-linked outer membrane protein [Pinibacter aurantiacus]|uniref:SusC/RagA family TonB-linked outer membrane protein n=1 Tax=Pinibacter aurantiacus TaxID=2851599 RepID=A0A9E2SC43_9BACT|nr:SusC/RagA family TonB-linked outer membrane protein [Pinibacter aurantiacus]MBV4358779.1 SusC/RagA family TonB-linked outer membrane protein [Pinibacter aurantiacus]